MEYNFFDVNKECYEIVNSSGWSIPELRRDIVKSSFYKLGLDKLSMEQVIVNALNYAKNKEYIDIIIQKIARKNGKYLAYRVFNTVFPDFNKITDLYDYCYKLFKENTDLKSISKTLGINISLLKYYARESKLGLTSEDEKRLEKRRKNIEDNYPIYYNAINFLYEHDKLEDIINYFNNIDSGFQGRNLLIYASSMFPDKKPDELKEVIRKRYDKYVKYKKAVIDANIKVVNDVSMVIEKFVDGIYPNILSFCIIENIDKRRFRYCLAVVKVHNHDLYKKYQEKILKIKNNEYSISFLELKKIVGYITYGIDGREFNLLDYFKLTNYDLNTFYHLVENSLNEIEYHKLIDFYRKYKNIGILSERYIFNEKREFYCDLDDNGLPIPGTGHIVTKEEKKEIMKMIETDGFKLYGPIYNIYLKKYFNEEKGKVLKKSL